MPKKFKGGLRFYSFGYLNLARTRWGNKMKKKIMSNSNYFEDENVLRDFGFTGFKSVKELTQSRCFEISEQPGVYMVLNTTNDYNIMDESVGGHFKGKNPTVPVKLLSENICDKTIVLYIGKAGGKSSQSNLRKRIHAYLRFGQGHPVGHWGGRYIWQLDNHQLFIVCWKVIENEEPRVIESALLHQFIEKYDCLPFANLVK